MEVSSSVDAAVDAVDGVAAAAAVLAIAADCCYATNPSNDAAMVPADGAPHLIKKEMGHIIARSYAGGEMKG